MVVSRMGEDGCRLSEAMWTPVSANVTHGGPAPAHGNFAMGFKRFFLKELLPATESRALSE